MSSPRLRAVTKGPAGRSSSPDFSCGSVRCVLSNFSGSWWCQAEKSVHISALRTAMEAYD